jgi:hypothetical protein
VEFEGVVPRAHPPSLEATSNSILVHSLAVRFCTETASLIIKAERMWNGPEGNF